LALFFREYEYSKNVDMGLIKRSYRIERYLLKDDGRYPHKYENESERPFAALNIQTVLLPKKDPVMGCHGGIQKYWL
jgi:hypothetical protein